jgi:hypothetical protein
MVSHKSAIVLLLAVLGLAACETTVNGKPVKKRSENEYETVSPFVVENIQQKLKDVPYLRGREVIEACSEITKIGPGAIPILQESAGDPDPMRRLFVMNVLGGIGDRRALELIHGGLADHDPSVRYEAARSCVRLGDWPMGMPVLIKGLTDESLYARSLCHETLKKQTRLDFGYNPRGANAERDQAAGRWRAWWERHSKATVAMRS